MHQYTVHRTTNDFGCWPCDINRPLWTALIGRVGTSLFFNFPSPFPSNISQGFCGPYFQLRLSSPYLINPLHTFHLFSSLLFSWASKDTIFSWKPMTSLFKAFRKLLEFSVCRLVPLVWSSPLQPSVVIFWQVHIFYDSVALKWNAQILCPAVTRDIANQKTGR
jgi:hypothetical protein